MSGCRSEAVNWKVKVRSPICVKLKRYELRSIGYSAGRSDCIMSFSRWQKLMAARMLKAVRPAAPTVLTGAGADSFKRDAPGDNVPHSAPEAHLSKRGWASPATKKRGAP